MPAPDKCAAADLSKESANYVLAAQGNAAERRIGEGPVGANQTHAD